MNICEKCMCYLLTHPELKAFLKCIGCGWSRMSNPIISLDKYLMGRQNQYPTEYTDTVKQNAERLLEKVNALLHELGIDVAEVSSGWRPAAINAATPNAAKKSYHTLALAIDIKDDKNQTLGKLIASKPELLKKYDLWLEDLSSTKGVYSNWCHLDLAVRADRPSRIFKP